MPVEKQLPGTAGTGGGTTSFAPAIPLIAAGAQLIGSFINAKAQSANNKEQREWNEKMYGIQRRDALADWNMQNAYNAPGAQMERLKAAGLNPHLVYGNGATATAGQGPRAASAPSWAPHAPQIDLSGLGNGIMNYYDAKIKQAQSDNLAVQRELMEQQKKNLIANEFKTYADTAGRESSTYGQDIKNKYAPQLAEMSLTGARTAIEKQLQDMDINRTKLGIALDQNERAALQQGMNFKEAAERILNMRKQRLVMEQSMAESRAREQNTRERTVSEMQRHEQIQDQIREINERIMNLKSSREGNDERNRILRSTPDWNDQRTIDMLESLIKGIGAPGTWMNPKIYQGFRK